MDGEWRKTIAILKGDGKDRKPIYLNPSRRKGYNGKLEQHRDEDKRKKRLMEMVEQKEERKKIDQKASER